MVCKHCGLPIKSCDPWGDDECVWEHANDEHGYGTCFFATGKNEAYNHHNFVATPSSQKYVIENVPVPVAKSKAKKIIKPKKAAKVAISGETLCKHCGLEIQYADGKWKHKQAPQYYSCNFANGKTDNYPGIEVAEPYEYVLEKVITENPVCKHCGLGIQPCKKQIGGGKTANKTGWKHNVNAKGGGYNCCKFATGNKAFSFKLQAEPSMLLVPESVPEVVKKLVEKLVVPESTETCMYCNAPVKLSGSDSCSFPNDWMHTSTESMSCWTSMTLDGKAHTADTLNQQNEYSKDDDKSGRTKFFQFLKDHFNKSGQTVNAVVNASLISRAAHEVNGRKFRIQHD